MFKHSFIPKFVISGFILLGYQLAIANEWQQVSYINAKISEIRTQAINHQIASNRLEDATIISETKITVSDRLHLPLVAFAIHDDDREIKISLSFINVLNSYTRDMADNIARLKTLSDEISEPNSSKLAAELDFLSEAMSVAFLQKESNRQKHVDLIHEYLLEAALSDVILHELGHHVEDAFHSYRASPSKVARIEAMAENWAKLYKADFAIDQSDIGRLITLASVLEYAGLHATQNQRMLDWAVYNIEQTCLLVNSSAANIYCASLKQDINQHTKNENTLSAKKLNPD